MRNIFLSFLIVLPFFLQAQTDSVTKITEPQSRYRISILTCGVGEELYTSFGHSAVRVYDSVTHNDDVYNYGTFDGYDPDFYTKFTLGKLLYYLSKTSYINFIEEYEDDKRSVKEQVLHLPEEQKLAIIKTLETNLLPQNRAYHYDFLFDNCATRIRDIFPKTLGVDFYFGNVIGNQKISYRGFINEYLANNHWARTGINLLLGSKVDSLANNDGSMFLPDFIFENLATAKYKKEKIVSESLTLLPDGQAHTRTINQPMWLMVIILLMTMLTFFLKPFRSFKNVWSRFLLFVVGALGCLMFFMWFFTNHQSCSYNFNILWALPLNLIVAFLPFKGKLWAKFYALIAITLMITALLLHVIGIQYLPLIEMLPLMLAMMYVYLHIYKQSLVAQ